MTCQGARSQMPWRITVAASFLQLELRRLCKEDYMEAGKSKAGVDYRTADKVMCSLEGCCGLFQRCVNLDVQKQ